MAKEEAVSFSTREMEVLALAWQCFESEPKIDIKKLARLTGYTDGSASATISKIKRKLKTHAAEIGDNDANATPAAAAKTPRSTGKRAAGSMAEESPSKKKKPTNSKMVADAADYAYAQDEDETYKIKKEEDREGSASYGYGGYSGYSAYDQYQGQYDAPL
ncbi:hypothetical protein BU23DRAFT_554580 [Bimuria novae-zelandiae CBS 107.79]|uniref:Uncharacterized protein n=1 Tax=Bimuria novae-zelandiae CBS 107.79 TaxID=1447943 RepID=A0A6A5V863_9PLEO|nr:hypothetical protein BU23DRAFT_554580 [Bimuria novae-zelandiae CBS 107.79]